MSHRPEIPVEVKRQVRTECGDRCAVCGCGAGLEIAHISAWSESGDNSPENLIYLCAGCHARADREKWGENHLRKYKDKPWVARQFERKVAQRGRKLKVVFYLEGECDVDDISNVREFVRSAIAGFQNKEPDGTGLAESGHDDSER